MEADVREEKSEPRASLGSQERNFAQGTLSSTVRFPSQDFASELVLTLGSWLISSLGGFALELPNVTETLPRPLDQCTGNTTSSIAIRSDLFRIPKLASDRVYPWTRSCPIQMLMDAPRGRRRCHSFPFAGYESHLARTRRRFTKGRKGRNLRCVAQVPFQRIQREHLHIHSVGTVETSGVWSQ